ncbi:hypothetical protein JM84_1158 [Dokdonia sp. Hel_I_63]|uniref:hypothetical protein n=1 Tax=Dokdonia sp. Hel_I_63 TaxID=1249996 RepID=UPI00119B1073|nr:hypothetical protein [Dokdonia sp. Hel_I_63]TVZ22267.1 hypothetical protein JM84_1158 [Dokdonia sp. Hel_I_63]
MILFIVLAKTCVSDYINGGDEYKISELEQMISENTVVTASLSNEYTESTVASVVKLYRFDYRFNLNDQSYTGKITLNAVPNTNKLNIYYLSDDPSIIAADPYEAIAREKEKGSSISELLIGIVWGVVAIILFISLIATIKSTKTPKSPTSGETKTVPKSIKTRTKKKAAAPVPEITPEEERLRALEKERIRREKEVPSRFMPK